MSRIRPESPHHPDLDLHDPPKTHATARPPTAAAAPHHDRARGRARARTPTTSAQDPRPTPPAPATPADVLLLTPAQRIEAPASPPARPPRSTPQRGAQPQDRPRPEATPRRPTAGVIHWPGVQLPECPPAAPRCGPQREDIHTAVTSSVPRITRATRQSARSSHSCDQRRQQPTRIEHVSGHPTRASALPCSRRSQHPVKPPLRRQHLDLLNPLIRRRVIRDQLQRDIESARAQQLHQRVQARRHHPLLPTRDHRPILPAPLANSCWLNPHEPRLPQSSPRSSPCPHARRHSSPKYLILRCMQICFCELQGRSKRVSVAVSPIFSSRTWPSIFAAEHGRSTTDAHAGDPSPPPPRRQAVPLPTRRARSMGIGDTARGHPDATRRTCRTTEDPKTPAQDSEKIRQNMSKQIGVYRGQPYKHGIAGPANSAKAWHAVQRGCPRLHVP